MRTRLSSLACARIFVGVGLALPWLSACSDREVSATASPARADVGSAQQQSGAAPADASSAAPSASPIWPTPSVRTFDRERFTVRAHDGLELVVWGKVPPHPRGAVLLVHGRTWSSIPDFDLQVPGAGVSLMDDLAAHGFATYAVDLRGYGATGRDEDGWTTPDEAAKDVAIVLGWVDERTPGAVDHRDRAHPVLFGWSNGSMVAQLVAQRHPELVEGVVLYGYPTGPSRAFENPRAKTPPRNATTAEAAASDFITPTVTDAVKDAFVKACLDADPQRADWKELTTWNQLDPARVEVPVMLIHGEHDPYAGPEAHAWFMKGVPHGDKRWVVVPEGDHAVHLESTRDVFVRALLGWIDRRAVVDGG